MDDGSTHATQVRPPARVPNARSLPSARPFNAAAFFSALHYLGLLATATALVVLLMEPSELALRLVTGGLGFSVVMWLVAFFKRRAALCPLCRGTPLVNSGALTHAKATRVFPLNHGVTAICSIIATRTFRCIYCASDFDLLKTPSRLRGKNGGDAAG